MSEYKTLALDGMKVNIPFRVLTGKSVLGIEPDNYDVEIEALYNEQMAVLESLGYDYFSEYVTFFGKAKGVECDGFYTMNEAVQGLALKDGVDLVEFENGCIGFVSYYRGFNNNFFYVVKDGSLSDYCDTEE